MVSMLEHCRVAPPPGTVTEQSIPLTFFDTLFLRFPPLQTLIFYEFPQPKTHFTNTVVPDLKHSLSLALKHFFPLAASLIVPSNSSLAELRYSNGDSVSLAFAEATANFDHLTGNHLRCADEFYPFVPLLPSPSNFSDSDAIVAPVLALQVTLFPNSGLCFGFTLRHAVADGRAFTHFMKTWASVAKLGADKALPPAGGPLPFHDRSVIADRYGLGAVLWAQDGEVNHEGSETRPHRLPTNKVRTTFVMTAGDAQRLKELISSRRQRWVSTFTVTCAYLWVCILKSRVATVAIDDDDEREHFFFAAECRRRLNPPLPDTYFGNCLVPCFATAKRTELLGKDGFVVAAESIREALERRLSNGAPEGVLGGAENWWSDYMAMNLKRPPISTAGSPKFGRYQVDFGWGRPKKYEIVSIDSADSISLCDCRDSPGDVEIGVSLPSITMDALVTIFSRGLKFL